VAAFNPATPVFSQISQINDLWCGHLSAFLLKICWVPVGAGIAGRRRMKLAIL